MKRVEWKIEGIAKFEGDCGILSLRFVTFRNISYFLYPLDADDE